MAWNITQAGLKEWLEYDPETGLFRWVPDLRGVNGRAWDWFKGSPGDGRPFIRLFGKNYFCHRLAWLYTYGEYVLGLDHINRDSGDNRIANLRKATKSQNQWNRKVESDNTSGTTGVHYSLVTRRQKCWVASINKEGKKYHKRFYTEAEAIEWRKNMEAQLFGEFAPSED